MQFNYYQPQLVYFYIYSNFRTRDNDCHCSTKCSSTEITTRSSNRLFLHSVRLYYWFHFIVHAGCFNQTVRLNNENSTESGNNGIVQYCFNGSWATLCRGGGVWQAREAIVTCRQLGYQGRGRVVPYVATMTTL